MIGRGGIKRDWAIAIPLFFSLVDKCHGTNVSSITLKLTTIFNCVNYSIPSSLFPLPSSIELL
jgi:hypothetical protein